MKALTLTPEWAWAVCHLGKRVENRTWKPTASMIGQTIALHAGKARPDWSAVDLMAGCAGWSVRTFDHGYRKPGISLRAPDRDALTRGAIVATFRLVRTHAVAKANCVGWECGPICWDIADVQVLARPVPCKGALGMWTVPADIAEQVCLSPSLRDGVLRG